MHSVRSAWLGGLLLCIGAAVGLWVVPNAATAQRASPVSPCATCPPGEPYFVTVPGTEQISNGIVSIVTQDTRGLTWIGTPEGLLSFDGYQLRRYRHDPADPQSISDDYVRALLAHSDGRLWIATQGGGLSIYDPQTDRFTRHAADGQPNSLPNNATISLAEGPRGEVWVGMGSAGVARHAAGSGEFEAFRHDPANPDGLADNTVRSLLFDGHGDLWLGTGNGLQRRRAGSAVFEPVQSDPHQADGFARQYVYSLFEASNGHIWIGTQSHGAARYDPERDVLRRYPGGAEGLGHPWISGFAEVTPGRIWVFTYGAGIDVIDAGSGALVQRIRNNPSIPGTLALDRLVAPYRDASGLLWVGTWGAGLQLHNPANAATFVTHRQGAEQLALRSANVYSTLAVGPSTLWVGSERGIDEFDLNVGLQRSYSAHPRNAGALRDGTIRAMAQTRDGTRWVASQQAGLQRFRPERGGFAEPLRLQRSGTIRRLLGSQDGGLWIGLQGGLLKLDPQTGRSQDVGLGEGGPLNDPVWSLVEDPAGNLWVGTPNRLLLLRPGAQWLEVVDSGNAPLSALVDMQIGPAGELWTSGPRGIARLTGWTAQQPQFEDYSRRLGELPQGLGQQLLFDGSGRLWGPSGMIDTAEHRLLPLGIADGIEIGSVAAGSGSRMDDGRLVFGGTRGLLVIDPRQFKPRVAQPALLVTGLEIDGDPRWLGAPKTGFELPSEAAGRFNLSYAALDYVGAASIRYAHRLVGLDRQWIESDASRRLATYTNLWPGEYVFEVRARQHPGDWGEALQVPMRVLPAWWQTWWAWTAAVLALLLLSLWVLRWRTLRIARRALALEALVEQRTAELMRAKERAESTLGELRGAQRQLVVAEKMASLGQLVAGVAHEINTPIGIAVTAASHLQEFSRRCAEQLEAGQLSRTGLRDWERDVEEGSALILGSLRRAAALIAGFKQVSVDQSSDQRRRFQLNEFLTEVQLALRPSLRGTAHELRVECEAGIEVDTFPGALFQILTNLLNNALLHAFAEGQSGVMQLAASAQGELVLLRFADNGRGMDAATAARAFDPFFTTRRGSGGSGLGLHIVHNLVTQLLGGSIELHTAPGVGAAFELRLPLQAPQRSEA